MIPVFFPSRDNKAMSATVATILLSIMKEGEQFAFFTCGGIGQAVAINQMCENARKVLKQTKVRAFWIEDDILIEPTMAVVNKIKNSRQTADQEGYNLVAPYKIANGRWTYFHDENKPYSDKEILAMHDFDPVDLAGLGFYYGDIDLSYVWHEGKPNKWSKYGGIDWNYFNDCNIKLRHLGINLFHQKDMLL